MMVTKTMRWTPAEWSFLAAAMLPDLDSGMPDKEALMRAQRLLPPSRRRQELQTNFSETRRTLKRTLERARAMSQAERDAMTVPVIKHPTHGAAATPGTTHSTTARQSVGAPTFGQANPWALPDTLGYAAKPGDKVKRWTNLEVATVSRAIDLMRRAGVVQTDRNIVILAQEYVLPPNRRHTAKQLGVAFCNNRLEKFLARGRKHAKLIKKVPLPQAFDLALHPEKAAPSPAPEPQAEPFKTAQEAAEPAQATQALPVPRKSLAEATQAFMGTILGALDQLLATHEALIVQQVESRFTSMSERIGSSVAAMIEKGMRQAVHSMVEQELGTVAAPAESPAQITAVTGHDVDHVQRPPRLKIDLIGLNGPNIARVRDEFNGQLDARYIEPEEAKKWVPSKERHVIAFIKFIPHTVNERIKKFGVPHTYLTGGPNLAIQAIENLMQQQGLTRAH